MTKAQKIQDNIFKKMSADKKIKLVSDLTMLVLELNKLDKTDKLNNNADKKNRK